MVRIKIIAVAVIMSYAAIVGLNSKASENEILVSMIVFFAFAFYVVNEMDKAERD